MILETRDGYSDQEVMEVLKGLPGILEKKVIDPGLISVSFQDSAYHKSVLEVKIVVKEMCWVHEDGDRSLDPC